jgi:TatD DNase family protein
MLRLAGNRRLPVIIHTREADDDTLAVLDTAGSVAMARDGRLGVIHCFTGGRALAHAAIQRGLYISFSGIVTFANAAPLREIACDLPAERLLLETDTPYLTPVPKRGQRNEPALLTHVAACVAKARGITVEALARLTTENAERLFGKWATSSDHSAQP